MNGLIDLSVLHKSYTYWNIPFKRMSDAIFKGCDRERLCQCPGKKTIIKIDNNTPTKTWMDW